MFDYTQIGLDYNRSFLTVAPTLELRYKISNRFQFLLSAQKDFYKFDSNIGDIDKIGLKFGVGYKF